MNRLQLNIKVRELIISDRKIDGRRTDELEWWIQSVDNYQRAVLAGLKKIGKVIDAYTS